MMFDQPKEPIFFHDEHRTFLENRTADALNWEVMRLNLYRLKTGMMFDTYWESWPGIIILGATGILCGGMGIMFLYAFGREGIEYLNQYGIPHWRLIVYALIVYGWFLALMVVSSMIGWALTKRTFNRIVWPDQRIASLLQRLVEEGQLIKGEIVTTGYKKFQWYATYRFITPAEKELECDFLLSHNRGPVRGTPVWVLYLNDKISALL